MPFNYSIAAKGIKRADSNQFGKSLLHWLNDIDKEYFIHRAISVHPIILFLAVKYSNRKLETD